MKWTIVLLIALITTLTGCFIGKSNAQWEAEWKLAELKGERDRILNRKENEFEIYKRNHVLDYEKILHGCEAVWVSSFAKNSKSETVFLLHGLCDGNRKYFKTTCYDFYHNLNTDNLNEHYRVRKENLKCIELESGDR